MANIFSQMFSQFGPGPAQRMDQGGGEYTGRIPGVYEGDDTYIPELRTMATPNPIATTGNGMTVRDDKEAIRQRLLARERKQLENARLAEGNTQPGSGLVRPPQGGGGELSAGSGASPLSSVLIGKDTSGTVVTKPTEEVVETATEAVTPQSIAESVVTQTTPEMVPRKTVEGLARNVLPHARNIAQIVGQSVPGAKQTPNVEEFWTGVYDDPLTKTAIGTGKVIGDFAGEQVDYWRDTLGVAPGTSVTQFFGDQADLYGGFYAPKIKSLKDDIIGFFTPDPMPEGNKPPSDPASATGIGSGDSIQEKAMSVLRPAGALAHKSVKGTGDMFGDRFWDIFYNSIPGLDQRGQSGNTVTTPTDMSPTMEGQVGPPAEFETVDQQQARVDAASGPQVFDRRRIKPAWMKWFTPDRFENENIYDDMTEEERRANLLARIAAGDNSMVTTRPVRQ